MKGRESVYIYSSGRNIGGLGEGLDAGCWILDAGCGLWLYVLLVGVIKVRGRSGESPKVRKSESPKGERPGV